MSLTVLEICQDAARELSLVVPSSVAETVDDITAEKLLRQLIRTCRFVSGRHDWQVLRREKTFTTTAAAAQTGAVATDLLRFIPMTMWNRTRRRRVDGPLSPAEWQAYEANINASVFDQMMMRGNAMLITPTPSTGHTIAYEYITRYIGTDADAATERYTFTADTDLPYFDDELLITGIVWRYRKSEGLDYSEEYRDFELRMAEMIKADGNRRILDMNDDKLEILPHVLGNTLEDLTSL